MACSEHLMRNLPNSNFPADTYPNAFWLGYLDRSREGQRKGKGMGKVEGRV